MDDAGVERLRERAARLPSDPVAGAELAIALAGRVEADRALAEAAMRIGNALRLGAHEPALEAATRLAATFDDPGLAVLLAEARLAGGDLDAARGPLEESVARHPLRDDARVLLAALAASDGEIEAALAWVEPVAERSAAAAALYAQGLLAAGRGADARDFAAEAVARHPAEGPLHAVLGLALLGCDEPSGAVAAFNEALALAPERTESYANLAFALAAEGSGSAALGVLDAALARHPDDAALVALRRELRSRS